MNGYDQIDFEMYSIILFITSYSLLVENITYFWRTFTGKQPKKTIIKDDGMIVEKEYNWRIPLVALITSLILAFLFVEHYFTWMPFSPIHVGLSRVFTAILMGRIAGAGHDGIEKIIQLFLGLIGRIRKKY